MFSSFGSSRGSKKLRDLEATWERQLQNLNNCSLYQKECLPKFYENPSTIYLEILLTVRETERKMHTLQTFHNFLVT